MDEAVYILERTRPGILIPRWLPAKSTTRFPIPRIDTHVANKISSRTPAPQSLADNAPETPSPRSPVDDSTPFPSPSTAFTTPEGSPQAKLGTLMDELLELKAKNARVEAKVKDLRAQVDVWVNRYMTEVVRERQQEEQRYAHRGLVISAGSH